MTFEEKDLLRRRLKIYSELLDVGNVDRKAVMIEMQRLAFKLREME